MVSRRSPKTPSLGLQRLSTPRAFLREARGAPKRRLESAPEPRRERPKAPAAEPGGAWRARGASPEASALAPRPRQRRGARQRRPSRQSGAMASPVSEAAGQPSAAPLPRPPARRERLSLASRAAFRAEAPEQGG